MPIVRPMPPRSSRTRRAAAPAVLLALALVGAGCANDPARMTLGTPQAQVLARLGAPTARYALPEGGERLQYSGQPAGQTVVNVDLDPGGRVRAVQQVLDESLFHAVRIDAWREVDVLRHLGPPAARGGVHAFDGVVWTWRYRQVTVDRLLHLFIDRAGTVRRLQLTDDLSRMPQDEH